MSREQRTQPRPKPDSLIAVTVQLTTAELAAISRVAAVVTSGGEPVFLNAADAALRKLRDAAKKHPKFLGGTP